MSTGEIIGEDYATCACCGGTKITIDHFQNPNGNGYFLVGSFPSNFTISNNAKFPIAVTLDWENDSTRCFGNYIVVTRIARR